MNSPLGKQELLRGMLNNLIDGNQEQASLDMHEYLKHKMREVAGLGQSQTDDSGINNTDLDDDEALNA